MLDNLAQQLRHQLRRFCSEGKMADEVANEVVDTVADAIKFLEGVKTAYNRSKDTSDHLTPFTWYSEKLSCFTSR